MCRLLININKQFIYAGIYWVLVYQYQIHHTLISSAPLGLHFHMFPLIKARWQSGLPVLFFGRFSNDLVTLGQSFNRFPILLRTHLDLVYSKFHSHACDHLQIHLHRHHHFYNVTNHYLVFYHQPILHYIHYHQDFS